jgi:D-inositol-3-phosphate glycosyltransferase
LSEVRALYSFPHVLGRPGIGTTALHQVLGLESQGIQVTVMCTSLQAELPEAIDVVTTLVLLGRRIPHRLVMGVQNAYRYHDWRVAQHLRTHAGDYDLVHAWPAGFLQTAKAARRHRVPVLREAPSPHTATALADASRASADTGVALPRNHSHYPDAALVRREEAEYAAATAVLAPSPYARQTFLDRGFGEERVLEHRYGCDLDRFWPEAAPMPSRPLTVLFVGRGEPNKGLHIALRAWQEAKLADPAACFLIAGKVLPTYAERLGPLLSDPTVRQLGFVRDVPALMRSADVLVLPSYTEGSALVVYEALASGCIPLVSEATGAPVEHDVDGLRHQVGDHAALAEQLRYLATHPAELARLRSAGLAARASYGWAPAAERLADIYRQVIATLG